MRTPNAILTLMLCPFFLFCQTTTPTVINSGGGFIQNENIALSYSIGEAVIPTIGEGFPLFSQGFEQPDSIYQFDIVDAVDFDPYEWKLKLFPNPAVELLIVEFENDKQDLEAVISDVKGRTIFTFPSLKSNIQNQINLKSIPSGTYLLRLTNNQQQFGVFKFLKINH